MRTTVKSFFREMLSDRSGQAMVLLACTMVGLIGVAGLTIDMGRAYALRNQLQNSVNAIGLAAAGKVANTGVLTSAAAEITAMEAANAIPGASVTWSGGPVCLNSLSPTGWDCTSDPNNNAVRITGTTSMNTTFMGYFGNQKLTVSATATASMANTMPPMNIALIEDLTGSMSTADATCGTNGTKFACTMNALQIFLGNTNPCPPTATTSCPDPAFSNVRVALFGFPNILTQNPDGSGTDYLHQIQTCTVGGPVAPAPFSVLTLPLEGATSYQPMTYSYTYKTGVAKTNTTQQFTSTYELTYNATNADANGFMSDYYDAADANKMTGGTDSTGGLNPSSALVQMIGYSNTAGTATKTGCLAIAPGGIAINGAVTPSGVAQAANGIVTGTVTPTPIVNTVDVGESITYLASVIYAAKAALIAEQALMTKKGMQTENVMVIQSDGNQSTQWIYFPQGQVTQSGATPGDSNEPTTAPFTGLYAGYNDRTPATISSTLGYSNLNSAINYGQVIAQKISPENAALEATGTVSGVYPDFLDECQQSIIAAQSATVAGIAVFSVGFGSDVGKGCSTYSGMNGAQDYSDVTALPVGAGGFLYTPNQGIVSIPGLDPCTTMKDIASPPNYFPNASYPYYIDVGSYFYADAAGGTCSDSSHLATKLAEIFQNLHSIFTKSKLIPNSTT